MLSYQRRVCGKFPTCSTFARHAFDICEFISHIIAISKTLEGALMANRMAYLGSVFLPLCMLLLIMDALHLKYNKYFLRILIVISVLVFGVTASAGYLDIYYKEVSIACVNGATKLIKVNGPLHNLYFIYLGTYLAGMVGTIIYYTFKKRENSL